MDSYLPIDPPLAHHTEFRSDQYLLFPNLFTGPQPTGLIQMHVIPESAERCEVVFHFCVSPHCEEPARERFRRTMQKLLPGTELSPPEPHPPPGPSASTRLTA